MRNKTDIRTCQEEPKKWINQKVMNLSRISKTEWKVKPRKVTKQNIERRTEKNVIFSKISLSIV